MIRSNLRALTVIGALLAAGMARAQDQPAGPPTPPPDAPTPDAAMPAPQAEPEPPAQDQTTAPAPAAQAPAVQVQTLSALDLFSTGRDAGLGDDLWKGSSADIARAVIPTLASKPL